MCLGAVQEVVPEVSSSMAREGDILLLCSDGLWGQLDMNELVSESGGGALSNENLTQWIQKAKQSKMHKSDNITLVLAKYNGKLGFFAGLFESVVSFFKK